MKRFATFRLLPNEQRAVITIVFLLLAITFLVKHHRKAEERVTPPASVESSR